MTQNNKGRDGGDRPAQNTSDTRHYTGFDWLANYLIFVAHAASLTIVVIDFLALLALLLSLAVGDAQ